MLELVYFKKFSDFYRKPHIKSFKDKIYTLGVGILSSMANLYQERKHKAIIVAISILSAGFLLYSLKLCKKIPVINTAIADPEVPSAEITNLWSNIQRNLGNLDRFMRMKNSIDPYFETTKRALSSEIKSTPYRQSLKTKLEAFLTTIKDKTQRLTGQSGVRCDE